MKFDKSLALVLCVLMLATLLTGCAAPATPIAAPKAAASAEPVKAARTMAPAAIAPATAAPAAQAPVEIEFYFQEGFGRPEAYGKLIADFESKNPGIKVKTRVTPYADFNSSLPVMWASNKVSDVVNTGGPDIKQYAFNGALLPLDDVFPAADRNKYTKGVVEEVMYNGKIYGAPWTDSAIGLYYNKDMFDAVGIKAPETLKDAWTWDQWLTNIQKITKTASDKQGKKVWGMVGSNNPLPEDYWNMWIIRSAGSADSNTFAAISPDGTKLTGYLDTPEAIQALKFYQKLYNEYQLLPKSDIPDAFGTEQAATYLAFVSVGSTLNTAFPKLKWGVMPLPYFKTPVTHTGSFAPSVSAKTTHPNEAKKFVQYLASPDAVRLLLTMQPGIPALLDPAIRKEVIDKQPYSQMFFDLNAEWGRARPSSPGHEIYNQIIGKQLMIDIAAGADVDKTVAKAIQDAEAQLAKYKK